jgi:hypothetical protein
MGWAQPANTLISGRPASSHTWSALWLERARGTFPATQVMPNTLSSGEAKASRIATASSWPGSVSIMMLRLIWSPSIIIMLEIALISVSILLITKAKTKINIEIVNNEFIPENGSSKRVKNNVLGSAALSIDTATIPKKPNTSINGITIKKADINPFLKSSELLAANTLCQTPWSNKFVAKTAIKNVRPAV